MLLLIVLNLIFLAISNASVINAPVLDGKIDDDTIGMTAVDLDASNCYKRECNFGNLVADSVRYEYLVEQPTGPKVSDVLVLLQGNNFKGVIEKGTELKRSHLTSSLSKNAVLVTGKLKGSVIKGALENSVNKYTQTHGSADFLQVAGGLIEFDFTQDEGKRLTSVQVLCVDCNAFTEIKDTTSYDVVMSEDLSKATFSNESFTALNTTDFDTLEKYIKKNKDVYPPIDGRIILHNIESAPEGNSAITIRTSTFLIGIMVLLQKFMSSV